MNWVSLSLDEAAPRKKKGSGRQNETKETKTKCADLIEPQSNLVYIGAALAIRHECHWVDFARSSLYPFVLHSASVFDKEYSGPKKNNNADQFASVIRRRSFPRRSSLAGLLVDYGVRPSVHESFEIVSRILRIPAVSKLPRPRIATSLPVY